MPVTRHILDPWRDAFLWRARLLDLPGERIGEALAEVDAHCAETGESPLDAFGDAADYATALVRSGARPADRPWHLGRLAWIAGTSFTATAALFTGVIGMVLGHDHESVDSGFVVGLVVAAVATPLVIWVMSRPFRGRWWRPATLCGWVACVVGLPLAAQGPLFSASPRVLVMAGCVILATALLPFAMGWFLADLIVDPRTGRNRLPHTAKGWHVAALLATVFALILGTAVVIAIVAG